MTFTPVETIALIIIILAVTKITVLVIKPMAWMNFTKKIYSSPKITQIVALILTAVILYYLLLEITIIQILATTAFVGMMFLVGLAPHMNKIIKKYRVQIKKGNIWKENWLYSLIWIALMAWGTKELFF